MRHRFKTYDVAEKFDRICVLLRPGDFETLRVAHPAGVSRWIREVVAEHVDELVAEQKKRAKAQAKALLATINDPNL